MNDIVNLVDLVKNVKACRICKDRADRKPLPHEPNPVFQISSTARILIAGQAPGLRVHKSGKPFTDPSGDRLRQWMSISPEDFYDDSQVAILPMGFCFPGYTEKGADLPPRQECARAWRMQFMDKLPNLKLILVIGGYAQKYHLPEYAHMRVHERVEMWRKVYDESDKIKHIPLPHPSWRNNAWLKRNTWFEVELIPFLQEQISVFLDKNEPG